MVQAGNVGEASKGRLSKKGEPVVEFTLAVEDRGGFTTWVKVNAYGGLVPICEGRMVSGDYVVVRGELINKSGGVLEVRAEEVIWA